MSFRFTDLPFASPVQVMDHDEELAVALVVLLSGGGAASGHGVVYSHRLIPLLDLLAHSFLRIAVVQGGDAQGQHSNHKQGRPKCPTRQQTLGLIFHVYTGIT